MFISLYDLISDTLKGEVLFVVPPFALYDRPSLAAHTLQGLASKAGHDVSILYSNILFGTFVTEDEYSSLCGMNYYLLGERLFARAAHDLAPLGNWAEKLYDYSAIMGKEKAEEIPYPVEMFVPSHTITYERLLAIEEQSFEFVSRLGEKIAHGGYKAVCCTSSYEQNNFCFALFRGIKTINPDIITLIGGDNCEGSMAEGLASIDKNRQVFNYIFSGESDKSFVHFLNRLKKGNLPKERIIQGEYFKNLNFAPVPDFTTYLEQLYRYHPRFKDHPENITLLYESSRGCWWGEKSQCAICGFQGEKMVFRTKKAEKVRNELISLYEYYGKKGIKNLQMTDLIMPKEFTRELFPALRENGVDYTIYYEEKASLKLDELFELKKGGVEEIQPGIENFSTKLLWKIHKGTSVKHNIDLLRFAQSLGIKVFWNYIWGIPGESLEDYKQILPLLPLLFHLPPPLALFHLSVSRFSPYFRNPEKYDIQNIRPIHSYAAVYPPEGDIHKLASIYTADYYAETHDNVSVIKEFAGIIGEWHKKWASLEEKPILHLSPSSGEMYLLIDTRRLEGAMPFHMVDRIKAETLLKSGRFTGSKEQEWALLNKLALNIEDFFIPLVTAPAELLKKMQLFLPNH